MAFRSLARNGTTLLQRYGTPLAQPTAQILSAATGPEAANTPVKAQVCRSMASSAAIKQEEPLYGGQTLQQIRARVFGDHIGNGLPSGRKLLRKKLVGAKIASYYGPQDLEKSDPLFEDEKAAR